MVPNPVHDCYPQLNSGNAPSMGPFTWKEDDPSAGIILALGSSERGMFSAFSLHVKGCIWPQC